MESQYKPSQETKEKWQNDPNSWIWGLFYFNKEDKRLFVSKKVEWMGTTLNFSNPKWIFFMIGFISFFTLVTFVMLRNN